MQVFIRLVVSAMQQSLTVSLALSFVVSFVLSFAYHMLIDPGRYLAKG